MDHYSKTSTAITALEGTAFAQSGKKKKTVGDKEKEPEAAKDPKNFDKEWWKDKECYRCGKKGHPASACSVKLLSDNDDKLICSSKSPSNAMAEIQKSMKAMDKAMTQLSETADFDDELFEEQLHAQLGVVGVKDARSEPWSGYSFATRALLLRNHWLLDNQTSVHIMCNPDFVDNLWEASQQMVLKCNGGKLLINEVANFKGFKRETWFLRNPMTNILSFFWSRVNTISLMMRMLSSSIGLPRATLIWCSSTTSAGCMCMTRTTPEVVILSWRQWRKMSLKFQSRLCQAKWSTISSVRWVLVGTARFMRRTIHAMVWYSGRKVRLCLDPVEMPKGAINFSLCLLVKWLFVGLGRNCPHPWLSLREWLYWLRVCQHSLFLQIVPVV